MSTNSKNWCDEDEHLRYEYFMDFNEWFDSEDGAYLRKEYRVNDISQPSKAFYAGDREGYEQAFIEYREIRRHQALGDNSFRELFDDDHWFERNLKRFDQLVDQLENRDVVPFIGAGISASGGFPTWKKHLRQQGRTAGLENDHLEKLLSNGHFEAVLEEIEYKRGREVFIQEIRDAFSRTGQITETILLISELFTDTIISTNYDRLIEKPFDTGAGNTFQIITGNNALDKPDSDRVTIIKLHGDIKEPSGCILSKSQYDQAYGNNEIDMNLPIPKLLEYYYKNSSLLFLGCSLNEDRTVKVFKKIKEIIGDFNAPQHFIIDQVPQSEPELRDRNEYLARLGITGIWFEKGQFDYIEDILRLARNELRYRGILPGKNKPELISTAPSS
ncbi:SIR2 family protein [Nitrospina sp. 32_T5]|uniref:SIR2 family protein n=1 Tax=unclassified Nitrospina TaxID=2638683 RepID=UPI003F9A4A2F